MDYNFADSFKWKFYSKQIFVTFISFDFTE